MRLLNALYQITYPKGYPMPEKNTGLMYTFAACLLLIAGFGVGYIAHTPPEPIIEMTVHGLFVNGKHVDLDSLKFKLPVVPDKGKDGKKKPGDLPAGQLGPAAFIDIPKELVVKNRTGVDGAGIPVSACLETIGNRLGYAELNGFVSHCSKAPGGQWTEKVQRQLEEYTGGYEYVCIVDTENCGNTSSWKNAAKMMLNQGELPVLCAVARLQGYNGRLVSHAVILTGYEECPRVVDVFGFDVKLKKSITSFTYVDCNFPDRVATMEASALPDKGVLCCMKPKKPVVTEDLFVMWYGDDAPKPAAKCPCSPCDCGSCACHLVKPAVQMTEQRGSPKSPELFGIESLVNILKDFKEAIFGSNGKPGLRDDIAGGLRDFYGTLRTGVIVAGGCVAGWMLWVGASLHKIANKA